jgi:hypothetical protein
LLEIHAVGEHVLERTSRFSDRHQPVRDATDIAQALAFPSCDFRPLTSAL